MSLLDVLIPAEDAPNHTQVPVCFSVLSTNSVLIIWDLQEYIFICILLIWHRNALLGVTNKPLLWTDVATSAQEFTYLMDVFFKVARGRPGFGCILSTSLKSWPHPTWNRSDICTITEMDLHYLKKQKQKTVFPKCVLFYLTGFINQILTCCSPHCFQASFRISSRRQLPATNTQIETHYLKSISLIDSFKRWQGRTDTSQPFPADFQRLSPQRHCRSSETVAVVKTDNPHKRAHTARSSLGNGAPCEPELVRWE